MLYTLALATLKSILKNPQKAEKLKKELLELRDAISAVWPPD